MTSYNQTRSVALTDRATGLAAPLMARIAAYRVYRRTLNELSDLSNRELADLGLSRSQVRGVALDAAYGPR